MDEKYYSTPSPSEQLFPNGNQPLPSVPSNQLGQSGPYTSGPFPPNQPAPYPPAPFSPNPAAPYPPNQPGPLPPGSFPPNQLAPYPPAPFPPNQPAPYPPGPFPPPAGYFPPNQQGNMMLQQRRALPRCMSCGTITQWNVEPLLLPRHIIIGGLLLFFFGGGLLYFLVVIIMRSNPDNRAKICPNCGARNLWTFIY